MVGDMPEGYDGNGELGVGTGVAAYDVVKCVLRGKNC